MKKLLVIDDEENMRHMLKAMVERHGYEATGAEDGLAAINQIKQKKYDYILCDVKMPRMDGMAFLEEGRELLRDTTVIMMSAYGSIDTAIAAMKAGAYDFISKPFKSDEVLLTLKKAEERKALQRENKKLKEELAEIRSENRIFGRMVAKSSLMKEVFALIRKVASYDTTVLITGESGTGKELVARAIHDNSDRKNKSFVAINCGSIPEHLIESELFGHVRGAFTGADARKIGLFEEAHQATLFLDEIGELPLSMQVKLLRVLQEQEIRPVGGTSQKKIDVRVLAATAKDLASEVKEGKFREDLYYRLNVVQIRLPSLRDRKEDLPILCHHFIKKFNNELKVTVEAITPEAMKAILVYSWPGNVRELENAVQRGVVVSEGRSIDLWHLPKRVTTFQNDAGKELLNLSTGGSLSLKSAQKILEAELIGKALLVCEGNKSHAAELLEISYPSLLSKIKQYGL